MTFRPLQKPSEITSQSWLVWRTTQDILPLQQIGRATKLDAGHVCVTQTQAVTTTIPVYTPETRVSSFNTSRTLSTFGRAHPSFFYQWSKNRDEDVSEDVHVKEKGRHLGLPPPKLPLNELKRDLKTLVNIVTNPICSIEKANHAQRA